MLGVVRCDEGDVETFYRLANDLIVEYYDTMWDEPPDDIRDVIRPPVWRWYRMNVCAPDGDYAWMIGFPKGPGRGNWKGASVEYTGTAPSVVPL